MKFYKFFMPLILVCYINAYAQTNIANANRHQEMMNIILQKPKKEIKTIGILVYEGFNNLDAMGPYQILKQISGAKTFLIAKKRGLVKNNSGVRIQVDTTTDEVNNLDIIVIPGGALETLLLTKDTSILNWIKLIDKKSIYTTSVCTGAWILGATGILKDKNATTNWYRADEMLLMYGAKFKEERWVKDGKYWTSAGVTAGMDMSLAIIDDLMGRQYTEAIMLDLEYNPKPPYIAGTPKTTDPLVADMMKEMYDMVMLPMIEKEKLRLINK